MNDYLYETGFVHPRFRLNGHTLDAEKLLKVAYDYIKEGLPHEKAIGDFLLDWFDRHDYINMRTSGTTGAPKNIRISKRQMVNSALATADFFEVGVNTKALHCLPAQFVAGKMMLVRAIILGWDLHLVAPSSTPLADTDHDFDFAALVPLQAEQSLEQLKRINKIILGGGKVSPSLSARLQKLGNDIWETYAMTETVTHIAAKKIGEPVFTTLPNVKVSLDERGCLVIDAPRVAEMPVVTNDLADTIDPHHFTWLGRIDNVINSGGVKLFPEQVEEKLSGKINGRFFVYGLADETLGEKLVLVVEGDHYAITEDIFTALDKFEKPKAVFFVKQFTETGSGKIQRAETVRLIPV